MKSLKNPLLLILVWIISLLALCLSFMFYSKGMSNDFQFSKAVAGTFLLMLYSAFFSFPAFLFFIIVSIVTLRSKKLSVGKKKLIMVCANLFDIAFTFGGLFILIMSDSIKNESTQHISNLSNIFAFYPLWVLIIVSCLLIVTLPFNYNRTDKI